VGAGGVLLQSLDHLYLELFVCAEMVIEFVPYPLGRTVEVFVILVLTDSQFFDFLTIIVSPSPMFT
jgi:hypothetical protein